MSGDGFTVQNIISGQESKETVQTMVPGEMSDATINTVGIRTVNRNWQTLK